MSGLAFVLAGAAAVASPVPPPTFSAAVESVYVDVSAYDKKSPLAGLTSSNFELRDNGVLQKVELVALESLPLTTLLVFDTSASVAGAKLAQLKLAGHVLLQRVRAGDETALVTFGSEIRFDVRPTTQVAAVGKALDALRAEGSTAVYDALYAATLLAPERGRSLIVLFTDGEDNLSMLDLADVAKVLERSNVIVHAVGLRQTGWSRRSEGFGRVGRDTLALGFLWGHGPDKVEEKTDSGSVNTLRRLAEATGGRFWAASDPHAFAGAFTAIAETMKTRYVLRYEPEGVGREGRHTLSVRLRGRRGTVHHRKAYFVGSSPP